MRSRSRRRGRGWGWARRGRGAYVGPRWRQSAAPDGKREILASYPAGACIGGGRVVWALGFPWRYVDGYKRLPPIIRRVASSSPRSHGAVALKDPSLGRSPCCSDRRIAEICSPRARCLSRALESAGPGGRWSCCVLWSVHGSEGVAEGVAVTGGGVDSAACGHQDRVHVAGLAPQASR